MLPSTPFQIKKQLYLDNDVKGTESIKTNVKQSDTLATIPASQSLYKDEVMYNIHYCDNLTLKVVSICMLKLLDRSIPKSTLPEVFTLQVVLSHSLMNTQDD